MMIPAEPTNHSFNQWQTSAKPARLLPTHQMTCWLLTLDKAVQLEKPMDRLLQIMDKHPLSLGVVIKGFSPQVRKDIIARLLELEEKGFLSIESGQNGRSLPINDSPDRRMAISSS